MKSVSLLLTLTLLITGCATSSNVSLAYQWGTMKLIENGSVTPEQVIAGVDTIRRLADRDASLTYGGFMDHVKTAVGFDSLQPSDRLVIQTLLNDAQLDLDLTQHSPLTDVHRGGINQRLVWIQQAAALSGG